MLYDVAHFSTENDGGKRKTKKKERKSVGVHRLERVPNTLFRQQGETGAIESKIQQV